MLDFKKFEFNQKKIYFIGTFHTNDENVINQLRKFLEEFKPELILIEGGFENASFEKENEAIQKGWEMGFVSFYAKQKNIPLEGNDPTEEKSIEFIKELYDKNTAFIYFILRNLSMALKQDWEISTEEKLKIIFDDFKDLTKWERYDYSTENFFKIFKSELNENFTLDKDYINYFDSNSKETKVNEISKKLNLFRDTFMINKLLEKLIEFNKILIVKGNSHLKSQEKILEELSNG